jgi:hypothetical protein
MKVMADRFLGRIFDHRDMTWKYSDGSSAAIPEECRIEMFAQMDGMGATFLRSYSILQRYKKQLGIG